MMAFHAFGTDECSFLGPVIHLIRHAESEHKPDDDTARVLEYIPDPKLTSRGREHCIQRNGFLRHQAKYITHILASPLSRALETAFLTLKSVTDRGVKVWALPELQSISSKPAGMGMSLADLKSRYEIKNGGTEAFTGEKRKLDKVPRLNVHNVNELKGEIDFRYMSTDWNYVQSKKEGRWSWKNQDWRSAYLKGFLRALASTGERAEIVVVCHSSSMGFLVNDLILHGDELDFSSYIFDGFGNLRPINASGVASARERSGVKTDSRTFIHKNFGALESSDHSNVKIQVDTKERGLDGKLGMKNGKVPRKSKIQKKCNVTREAKAIGKLRVHKEAQDKRETTTRGKHHMILRSRFRPE